MVAQKTCGRPPLVTDAARTAWEPFRGSRPFRIAFAGRCACFSPVHTGRASPSAERFDVRFLTEHPRRGRILARSIALVPFRSPRQFQTVLPGILPLFFANFSSPKNARQDVVGERCGGAALARFRGPRAFPLVFARRCARFSAGRAGIANPSAERFRVLFSSGTSARQAHSAKSTALVPLRSPRPFRLAFHRRCARVLAGTPRWPNRRGRAPLTEGAKSAVLATFSAARALLR